MLNLKKTAVAVLALGSSAAFAGTMGPVCSAVPVTMPCESSGWEVGARALWWNIGSGNATQTLTSSSGGALTSDVGPGFGWGFQINGAMTYGTGKDVALNWYHIKNTQSRSSANAVTLTGNPSFVVGGSNFFTTATVTSVTNTAASASSSPKLDDVNMIFGQHVDFSDTTSAHLGWGWKWARVGGTDSAAAAGDVVTTSSTGGSPYNFTVNDSHTFNGFGPDVNLMAQYEVIDHLNIYGQGDFAALAGFSKSSVTYGAVTAGASATASSSTVAITPVVAGKLGLNYDWDMTGWGVVGFDVNYDFRQYINAFHTTNPSLGENTRTTSSFSAQGITFGLDLKWMNV